MRPRPMPLFLRSAPGRSHGLLAATVGCGTLWLAIVAGAMLEVDSTVLVAFGVLGVLGTVAVLIAIQLQHTRLASMAATDALTALPNHRAFHEALAVELDRSRPLSTPISLVALDIDGFKEINDTHGHIVGDRVLREAAAAIAGRVRETDFPARLGGDEFVVICPETGADGMRTVAEGLERTLGEDRIAASVGFADRRATDEGPSDLIARADAEMYRRKRESGNGRSRAAEPVAA
jgi:two-component system, sensor histidine kinase LadS